MAPAFGHMRRGCVCRGLHCRIFVFLLRGRQRSVYFQTATEDSRHSATELVSLVPGWPFQTSEVVTRRFRKSTRRSIYCHCRIWIARHIYDPTCQQSSRSRRKPTLPLMLILALRFLPKTTAGSIQCACDDGLAVDAERPSRISELFHHWFPTTLPRAILLALLSATPQTGSESGTTHGVAANGDSSALARSTAASTKDWLGRPFNDFSISA